MSPSAGPGIEYTATPNPNAVKFTLQKQVVEKGSRSYSSRFEALDDPFVCAVFEIPGVQNLFLMNDFITITKDPAAAWEDILPAAAAAIREHLLEEQG